MEPLKIKRSDIYYELNKSELTAEVVHSPNARGVIVFPSLITFESKEYKVINIKEKAFKRNHNINSIVISDDSNFRSISKNAFLISTIKSLYISSQVEDLEDGWCHDARFLEMVTISPSNKHFKYLDDDHQIIVGKSVKNADTFDTIVFANRNIKQATIPRYIKHIKPFAFENCLKLITIEISEDSELLSIGQKAFYNTSFENIFIPSNVETLGNGWIAENSKIKTVTISPSNKHFKYFGNGHQIIVGKSDKNSDTFDSIIFADHDIERVKIPECIKYIKQYAFQYCKKLTTIEISEDSELLALDKNAFISSSITSLFIPSKVEKLEEKLFTLTKELKTVTFSPSNKNFKYLDDEHQIIVGKSDKNSDTFDTIIFANRNIKKVIIPKYIKYIKSNAFEYCKCMETIVFSEDSELLVIGKRAFCESAINEITIPKSVTKIKSHAFFFCYNLQSVSFEEGSKLHSLKIYSFSWNSKLNTVSIPDDSSLKVIRSEAFTFSPIKKFHISKNVETIEENWFGNSSSSNVLITLSAMNKHFKYMDNDHQVIIGKSDKNSDDFDTIIFALCSIKHFIIPKNIKYIYSNAFHKCSELKTVKIPEDSLLVSFPCNFVSKTQLGSLFIPPNLIYFEDDWCNNTKNLVKITISPLNKHFKYLDDTKQIIVGKSDTKTDNFDTIIFASRNIKKVRIPKHIKYIKSYAFEYCKDLSVFEISKDSEMEKIGRFAFAYSNLKEITIPKNVRKIKNCAFFCCNELEKVTFEDGSKFQSLENDTFFSCISLQSINITDNSSLRQITEGSLTLSSIKSLFIPASVEIIEDGFINYMSKLKTVTVSPSNKNIKYLNDEHQVIIGKSDNKSDTFDSIIFGSRDIKHVSIPKYVRFIYSSAFECCKNLKTIDIPDDSEIEFIGSHAFNDTSLVSMKIPKKITKMGDKIICKNIQFLEYLPDKMIDCDDGCILDELKKLSLASFPNVQSISISDIFIRQSNCTIFVSAGVKVELINDYNETL